MKLYFFSMVRIRHPSLSPWSSFSYVFPEEWVVWNGQCQFPIQLKIIAISCERSISPWGMIISKLTESRVTEGQKTRSISGSLVRLGRGSTLLPVHYSWTCTFWLWEKEHHISVVSSEHILNFVRQYPASLGIGTKIEYRIVHCTIP